MATCQFQWKPDLEVSVQTFDRRPTCSFHRAVESMEEL